MPRIRKRTSNRQGTNDRRKISNKVKESRKRKKKLAKKNPQWKSKHKKDPGIPNDFPYKDQILAEVAEQRRLTAEEKEKRKEEKRSTRTQAGDNTEDRDSEGDEEQDGGQESPSSKGLDVGSEAIASLSAKLINPKLTAKKTESLVDVVEPDDDEVLAPANHDLPNLKAILDGSDVLLEVLDARDPLPYRSAYLEKAMEGKKVLLVLNKIDTCPREALSAWLTFLRRDCPTHLFRSATAFLPAGSESTASAVNSKGKSKVSLPKDDALGAEAILAQLSTWAMEKGANPLNVAVIGLANAGKSSFLNSLLHKAALPVYSLSTSSRGPTTTTLPYQVTVQVDGQSIQFVDTPGLTWSVTGNSDSLESLRAKDILLRSKGRIDRLKDASHVVAHITSRASTEDLMVMYNLAAFVKGDPSAFLSGVARSNQLVKKRGQLDLSGASRIVLRDWSTGKFMRYTLPPVDPHGERRKEQDLDDVDEKVLGHARTRREIRRSGGLVKLSASEIEKREVPLELPWEGEDSDEEDDKSDEEDDEMDGASLDREMDVDEDDENGSGQDEDSDRGGSQIEKDAEERIALPVSGKRKRHVSFESALPTKKTAIIPPGKRNHKLAHSENGPEEPKLVQKSILKKQTTTLKPKQKHSKPIVTRTKGLAGASGRVANAVTHKNKNSSAADPNAYDFSKFF